MGYSASLPRAVAVLYECAAARVAPLPVVPVQGLGFRVLGECAAARVAPLPVVPVQVSGFGV